MVRAKARRAVAGPAPSICARARRASANHSASAASCARHGIGCARGSSVTPELGGRRSARAAAAGDRRRDPRGGGRPSWASPLGLRLGAFPAAAAGGGGGGGGFGPACRARARLFGFAAACSSGSGASGSPSRRRSACQYAKSSSGASASVGSRGCSPGIGTTIRPTSTATKSHASAVSLTSPAIVAQFFSAAGKAFCAARRCHRSRGVTSRPQSEGGVHSPLTRGDAAELLRVTRSSSPRHMKNSSAMMIVDTALFQLSLNLIALRIPAPSAALS